jgi:hypothetical protein
MSIRQPVVFFMRLVVSLKIMVFRDVALVHWWIHSKIFEKQAASVIMLEYTEDGVNGSLLNIGVQVPNYSLTSQESIILTLVYY